MSSLGQGLGPTQTTKIKKLELYWLTLTQSQSLLADNVSLKSVFIDVLTDLSLRKSFGPSCRYQDSKEASPKNFSKSAMSVISRSQAKETVASRLPYQGFHAYPWNLQRPAPGSGAAGPEYHYNYYNTNPYYRSWFHNYKEQWHQHWQRFRGAAQYNEKFSSLLGKLPRSKSFVRCVCEGKSFPELILIS